MMLQRYHFQVKHRQGSSLHIADTLSWATLDDSVSAKVQGFEVFRLEIEATPIDRNPGLLPRTEARLQDAYQNEPGKVSLLSLISKGWPQTKTSIPIQLHPYWFFGDELSVINGIVYRGAQVLIPPSLQKGILSSIHRNHMGTESNLRIAKDISFWPGMRSAIVDICNACTVCTQYGSLEPKDPMQSLPVPSTACKFVSPDICTIGCSNYLVSVCHYSDWIEVEKLENMHADTIVQKTKAHFARFGIPEYAHTYEPQLFQENTSSSLVTTLSKTLCLHLTIQKEMRRQNQLSRYLSRCWMIDYIKVLQHINTKRVIQCQNRWVH